MFAFSRQRFFDDFEARTRLPLTAARRAALEHLLSCVERDAGLTMLREIAYMLATIRWETAHTFLPVEERRCSAQRQPDLHRRQSEYWGFHGRGYVQITWERNYRRAAKELEGCEYRVGDAPLRIAPAVFVEQPALVMDPAISYDIASRGMRNGWFTGKKLGDYIREEAAPDYVSARRVINGLDHAQDIAAYADQFELLLRGAAETPAVRRAARRKAHAKRARGKPKSGSKRRVVRGGGRSTGARRRVSA
jgi:hypothetical protein